MTLGTMRKGEHVHPRTGDFALQSGYSLERLVGGLTYASNVEITPEGEIYLAEAGFSYPYVFTDARLSRLTAEGELETVCEDFFGPLVGVTWHDGALLVTDRGRLSRVTPDGRRETLVDGLPSLGDHHTNHIVVRGTDVFFGQGTATNSGVVGPDNLLLYGWLLNHRDVHDVPAHDVTLAGLDFTSRDPFDPLRTVRTGAFLPFGEFSMPGQLVRGSVKSNGVIYRYDLITDALEAYCWGLRNPYALAAAPDGRLWTIEQGADDRGSRPLHGKDALYEVRRDAWYGFPDWFGGHPAPLVAEHCDMENPKGFVMRDHPVRTAPAYVFEEEHVAATGLDFSRNDDFGYYGQAFVTCFGSAAPTTTGGKLFHVGQTIVRLDMETFETHDFYRNENPGYGGTGPERPVACRFSPEGDALYVVDYGRLGVPGTGGLWRIAPAWG